MKLILFNKKINLFEIFNKNIVKKLKNNKWLKYNKNTIILIINNKPSESTFILTFFLTKFDSINEIYYFGCATSINENIKKNEIICIENCYNLLVDLTKFNYEIGKYPNENFEKNNKNLRFRIHLQKKYEKIKFLNIGSANSKINKDYINWIKNKFFDKKIELIDSISANIFFTCNKFQIPKIFSIQIINKEIIKSNNNFISKFSIKNIFDDIFIY